MQRLKITVRKVESCPHNVKEWKEAAARKGCEKMTCSSFEYHCVINAWGNGTREVCAPRLLIIGKNIYRYINVSVNFIVYLNHFFLVVLFYFLNRYFFLMQEMFAQNIRVGKKRKKGFNATTLYHVKNFLFYFSNESFKCKLNFIVYFIKIKYK